MDQLWSTVAPYVGGVAVVIALISSLLFSRFAGANKRRHLMEEKAWHDLQLTGRRAEAELLGITRPAGDLAVSHRGSMMAVVEVEVQFYDGAGTRHQQGVKTLIAEELLADLTVGTKLPILYSSDHPPLVVIDRGRTHLS